MIPHTLQQENNQNNKHQYNNYRHDLSLLLIGSHSDVVSGWLTLASFFCVHKHYLQSIAIINYVLSKCQNEFPVSDSNFMFIKKQECELKMIMQERLSSVWKKIIIQKVVLKSFVLPIELACNIHEEVVYSFDPILFAHQLSVLSNYHLKDNISCRQSMLQYIDRLHTIFTLEGLKNNNVIQDIALYILSNQNLTRQFDECVARWVNMFIKVL
ncbi:unnamed protein product [Mytilus coruscus]|uniref:Uncharacterized protein n=1 Tax=Mytilus coruscus TaxID=42192 RepID=A0A6J8C105_MYTCO|nr:unnamed protein product [Mytilus coruscus]